MHTYARSVRSDYFRLVSERRNHADIIDAVRKDREIKPETDKKLREVLGAFVKTFAA